MTENMKKFLELMSTKDKEIKEKAAKMEKDELIAFAADHSLTLTGADFEQPDPEGEISLDEAEAVAGGGECYCVAGGGGTGGDDDSFCACVVFGEGMPNDVITDRCECFMYGQGETWNQ